MSKTKFSDADIVKVKRRPRRQTACAKPGKRARKTNARDEAQKLPGIKEVRSSQIDLLSCPKRQASVHPWFS
jgi:hypothetical protein